MNTLKTAAVSALLDRLFTHAEQTDAALRQELGKLTPQARQDFMAGAKSDYRGFYGKVRDHYLPVSRETGTLLYMLARTSKARTIVEYGTSFGISTVHLAAALRDNGGGRMIGSEFEPGKVARARENLVTAGLVDLVEIREGDALQTLSRDVPEAIDLVLLDGAKVLYPQILEMLEPHLAPRALVLSDNADDSPELVQRVRQSGRYMSVPVSEEVELSMWLG